MQRLLKKVTTWLRRLVAKMAYDPAKVYFITTTTVDKILYESPTTSNTYTGGGPSAPIAHSFSIAHTIGESVIVNGMFSIDGANFYPCGVQLPGAVSGTFFLPQYLLCDMYADASNVHVYIENGFDTTQTVYIYYNLEALS